MMIIVNRTENVISGSVNGQQFGVSFDEEKYRLMTELRDKANAATSVDELNKIIEEFNPLTKESYKETVETKSPYILVNKHTNKFYLKWNDTVSSQPLPQVFVDKILKSVEKNIDITPLIKCWARYMRPIPGRPAYNLQHAALFAEYISATYTSDDIVGKLKKDDGLSDAVAREMATTTQVSITQEGLLVCYKVSKELQDKHILNEKEEAETVSRFGKEIDEDTGLVTYKAAEFSEDRVFEPYVMGQGGDAFKCVGRGIDKLSHTIRVGCSHFLESWDQVGNPGHKGLHCGGLNYIRGYQKDNTVTHNIFVDPMDIYGIAGLGIGNDGAMTVRRYFVHSSFNGVNKTIYHSSDYAAITDAEFADIVKEAVEATKMKVEEAQKMLEGTQALTNIGAATKDGSSPVDAAKVFKDGE